LVTLIALALSVVLLRGSQDVAELSLLQTGSLELRLPPRLSADPISNRTKCARPASHYADGHKREEICPADAAKLGLSIVDLSDGWLSALFDEAPTMGNVGTLAYRETLQALAAGRTDELPENHRAQRDRFLELYGVMPTVSRVRSWLLDETRHLCHDKVSKTALQTLVRPVDAWRPLEKQRADRWTVRTLAERLAQGAKRRGMASIDGLRDDERYGPTYRQWARLQVRVGAIAAAQAHLRCDGFLLGSPRVGVLDSRSHSALSLYQRRHALISWTLDQESASRMALDSRELDFRVLLRVPRERVVDAAGLIEDGTARGAPGLVLGRQLDAEGFHRVGRWPAIADGAVDHISPAVEAAARALGWTSPSAARRFLQETTPEELAGMRVAVRLPRRPRYHAPHMELRAEIDRGDIRYDYPLTGSGLRRVPLPKRRATLVLYAKNGDREIALMRWGTTVGGWKPERVGGSKQVRMAYKESPVGSRIWRDLLVTPRWIPPTTTPKRDLVLPVRGGWRLKQELMGPSYASAYGLVMLIHHRVDGPELLTDQGIRTHGSVSYASIHKGTSHGCHRLHNHRAVRLGAFLLKHRKHIRHGAEPLPIVRPLMWRGKRLHLRFTTRGHRYELDPPVAVEVTRGRVIGKRRRPAVGTTPLPTSLLRRFSGE